MASNALTAELWPDDAATLTAGLIMATEVWEEGETSKRVVMIAAERLACWPMDQATSPFVAAALGNMYSHC